MASVKIYNPAAVGKPRGAYSHVAEAAAGAKLVFIAGQVAVDRDGNAVGIGDFDKQCAQIYANLHETLKAAGGDWKNVVQFMTFLVRREDIPRFAAYRQREYPKLYPDGAYPPNTLVVVHSLVSEAMLLEIQAIAAV